MITNTDKKVIRQAGRTPRALFDTLNAEYRFDVDCFASISNHLLPCYWTRAHNAFAQRLNGRRGFANPPFGIIRRALDWAYAQRHESFTCFLLPANIETGWYLEVATKGDKHCFDKRVAYEAPPGVEYSQPSFASCLVMFGPDECASDLGFSALRSGDSGEIIRHNRRDVSGHAIETTFGGASADVARFTLNGDPKYHLTPAPRPYGAIIPDRHIEADKYVPPGFIDDDLPF